VEDMVFGRRYRVTERIGSGGMADVYKAVDETLGRTVAVKVLHERFSTDPEFVQRFRHEASAAANLSHPGIVNIYDYGVENGTYYIVMELVRGTDLKQVVKERGALDPMKVADYGAQACAALTIAHGYGIIHRDIKPQNIVLTPDGVVKVMDFGIARAIDSDATQTGSVLGTAQYVSPEQAQGRKLGPESDLYSLGVVLYELSTGQLPFDGDTPVSVALKHVNDEPVPPRSVNPAIPPALEAVILKAMDKDPTRRYRSADDMRDDLQRVVAGRAVTAQPRVGDTTVMPAVQRTPVAPVVTRPKTENREVSPWAWVAVAVLVILLGLGLAFATGLLGGGGLRVPDTTGMSAVDAKKTLVDLGLTIGAEETTADASVPKDAVISTTPSAGTTVDKGSAVDLLVSSGPQMVKVPNVVGSGETTAVRDLQKDGFAVDPFINRAFNSKYPSGVVFKTDPAGGTDAIKGAKVQLWVSQGAEMVGVPSVANLLQADAAKQLSDAGFNVRVVQQSDKSTAKGTVISQKPAGGTQAVKGSTVTIYVSSGQKQVNLPKLVGLTQAEAVAKIQALGLVESVQTIYDADPSHNGYVVNQDPGEHQKVSEGATVTIWVATTTP
jgi:beta-lactam-binding protein with PASTA domain/tRNA A-37 threonylcarbamoyl transferase component Bud32